MLQGQRLAAAAAAALPNIVMWWTADTASRGAATRSVGHTNGLLCMGMVLLFFFKAMSFKGRSFIKYSTVLS